MDPATERKWRSPLPTRCFACTAKSKREQQYQGDDVRHGQALYFGAELSP